MGARGPNLWTKPGGVENVLGFYLNRLAGG
jgi:hypothetical protein